MTKGVVKWFNSSKGYGYIQAENSYKDIFVHQSVIDMNGFSMPRTGQPVMFDATYSPKGLYTTTMILLPPGNKYPH